MAIINKKIDVYNPISHFKTVGRELESILEVQGIDKEAILEEFQWDSFESKSKIFKKEFSKLNKFIENGDIIIPYLESFQESYHENKQKAAIGYAESKKQFRVLKNALSLMYGEFNEGVDLLEDIVDFFGVEDEREIFDLSDKYEVLFRSQNNVSVDPINLITWLRRGEIDFYEMNVSKYNSSDLIDWIEKGGWKNYIENVEYFKNLPNELSRIGVALTYTPYLPKTVYGAVRWIKETPLIQISDRNGDLASCWYTLFHEFGHVIKHHNVDILEGNIEEKVTRKSKKEVYEKEKEANQFASNYLFNGDRLRKRLFADPNKEDLSTQYLSDYYGVEPLFVRYWQRKSGAIPPYMKTSISFTR